MENQSFFILLRESQKAVENVCSPPLHHAHRVEEKNSRNGNQSKHVHLIQFIWLKSCMEEALSRVQCVRENGWIKLTVPTEM